MLATVHSRPMSFRRSLGLPLLIMAVLLAVDPSPLDFALEHLFYRPGEGFVGRHSFWLEDILHDRAKQAVIALGVFTLAGFAASLAVRRWHTWRRPLGFLVLALGVSTSLVSPLKTLTRVHCPWDLVEFGGQEVFSPLLSPRAPTDKPGRCWPGGHASAGFSLLAFFFVLRDRRPRLARTALVFALGLGAVFSLGRMAQGAHFLSHNLWTLLLDWVTCVLCYRLVLYRRPQPAMDGVRPVGRLEQAR